MIKRRRLERLNERKKMKGRRVGERKCTRRKGRRGKAHVISKNGGGGK